jgi:predicted RNase H-like HicB family nuclease
MDPIRVIYHQESDGWWADSPEVPGWTATADTLDELRALVEEGVRFALDRDDVVIAHCLPGEELVPAAEVVYDFVHGRTIRRRQGVLIGHPVSGAPQLA